MCERGMCVLLSLFVLLSNNVGFCTNRTGALLNIIVVSKLEILYCGYLVDICVH